jgi:hypothetical protein
VFLARHPERGRVRPERGRRWRALARRSRRAPSVHVPFHDPEEHPLAELFACELAMKMFKRTQEELVPQVKAVITAGDFYDLSEGAQIIFT